MEFKEYSQSIIDDPSGRQKIEDLRILAEFFEFQYSSYAKYVRFYPEKHLERPKIFNDEYLARVEFLESFYSGLVHSFNGYLNSMLYAWRRKHPPKPSE